MSGRNIKPHLVTDDGIIKSPQLGKTSAFLQIWAGLVHDTPTPLYKNFAAEDLPNQLWRNLFIANVELSPFTVIFRYQGMYITDQLGQHFAGKKLSEDLFGESFGAIESLYHLTCQEQKPVLSREMVTSKSGLRTLNEVIHVPFYNAKGKVSQICGVIESMNLPDESIKAGKDIPKEWLVEFSGTIDI